MINRNTFQSEIELIRSETVKTLVIRALARVPDGFWLAPASLSGKYHPVYSLGTGGLVRHTKAAVWIAQQRLSLKGSPFQGITVDYILAALMLHDTAKGGIDWKKTHFCHEHPLLVAEYLPEERENADWNAICDLIQTHMGEWTQTKYSETVLPEIKTPAQFFVHECDYLASRKELNLASLFSDIPAKGRRVKLIKMDDIQGVPPGTRGIVTDIDDMGTIHVQWDNGSSLGLIPGVDEYEFVEEANV